MLERMIAQQGRFSIARSPLTSHGDLIAKHMQHHRREFWCKWIVPKETKSEFLRQLRFMNITAAALFPGLDGLGRSVGEAILAKMPFVLEL